MELTLVRHGVTDWNAQRKFQGQTDLPLTEEGRAQAVRLAHWLSNPGVDRVYTSDLRRAKETALAIAAPHGLQPVEDVRLREFSFGAWEGLTWAEILAANPHLSEMSYRSAHLYAPAGGEDFAAVCARMESFYAGVASEQFERTIVVTHAGALHATLGVLQLTPASAQDVPVNFQPASVTRIAYDGRAWRLISGPTTPP